MFTFELSRAISPTGAIREQLLAPFSVVGDSLVE
jgi:hypothetical protein